MATDENLLKTGVEEVLTKAKHPAASRYVLALLFPKLQKTLSTYVGLRDSEPSHRRTQRLANGEFARSYFSLSPEAASWGRQELESVLNSPPSDAMRLAEQRVEDAAPEDRPTLRRQFLDGLEGAFNDERPLSAEWLLALANFSPSYLKARDLTASLMYFTGNDQRLRRVILVAFESVAPDGRGARFVYAATNASDLSLLCDFFRTMVGDKNPSGARRGDRTYFGPDTENIRQLLVDRVKELANTNSFWAQALPGDLLWFWWGSEASGLNEFTSEAIEDETGFRALLVVAIHRVYSTAGDYDTVNPAWSKIVDLGRLEAKARAALGSNAPEREQAEKFLLALNRARNDPI